MRFMSTATVQIGPALDGWAGPGRAAGCSIWAGTLENSFYFQTTAAFLRPNRRASDSSSGCRHRRFSRKTGDEPRSRIYGRSI